MIHPPTRLAEPLERVLDRVQASWQPIVEAWRKTPQALKLITYVDERIAAGAIVYPAELLRALTLILPLMYPHYTIIRSGVVLHSYCSGSLSSIFIYFLLDHYIVL